MTERSDVRETYDRIATHFAESRSRVWEPVAEFLAGRAGAVALDVGVGNGRHAELLADGFDRVVGLDISEAVLETAADRACARHYDLELVQGEASVLPLATGSVAGVVSVATIHHLPTRALRVRCLDEVARVLEPDGIAIVSAWAVTHETFDASVAFDTTVDWTLPDGETVPRYYHVYDLPTFRADVEASSLAADAVFEKGGNCYATVEQA